MKMPAQKSALLCALATAAFFPGFATAPAASPRALTDASGKKSEWEMFYGGFAYSGADAKVAERYPYSFAANERMNNDERVMDAACRGYFKQGRASADNAGNAPVPLSDHVRLKFGSASARDTHLVLALVQTEERVLQENVGSFHKMVVTLGFNLLVMDYEGMEIVSSQPFALELTDAARQPFTDERIRGRVREMLVGETSMLAKEVQKRLPLVRGPGKNQATLRVTSVTIGDKALPFLPSRLRETPGLYAEFVGQQFSACLAKNAGVAVLPYAKDASAAKMSLVFSDSSVLQFQIPQPSYGISLDLRGFKKVRGEQTAVEVVWIFGAFIKLNINDPEFGKVYWEKEFKHPFPDSYLLSQGDDVDGFYCASEALNGVFRAAVEAMLADKKLRKDILDKCHL